MLLSGGVGDGAEAPGLASGCCLPFLSTMVEVEEVREELLPKGLRWVFASSVGEGRGQLWYSSGPRTSQKGQWS